MRQSMARFVVVLAGALLHTVMATAQIQETYPTNPEDLGQLGGSGPTPVGAGPKEWTKTFDRDGDGVDDYKWNDVRTDSGGNQVCVYALSKGGWRFALVYNGRIVGQCPYEGGCNQGILTRDVPGGVFVKTEWESLDQQYGDRDDDNDGNVDKMLYNYDIPTNKLDARNQHGGVTQVQRLGLPPPLIGSGDLPFAAGTLLNIGCSRLPDKIPALDWSGIAVMVSLISILGWILVHKGLVRA